jgi:hypothetical protein
MFLSGIDAEFQMRAQGFLGFGVGIVDKTYPSVQFGLTGAPNEWLVDTTFNVYNIRLDIAQGVFRYQQISPINQADTAFAGLMAFGPIGQGLLDNGYTFSVLPFLQMGTPDLEDFTMAGGGNIVKILPGDGPIHPIVLNVDGQSPTEPRLSSGLLMSLGVETSTTAPTIFNADVNAAFDFFKTPEIDQVFLTRFGSYRASVGRFSFGRQVIGFIDGGVIVREITPQILNSNLEIVDPEMALKQSIVSLFLNGPMGVPSIKPRAILQSPLYGKQVFQLVSPNV